MRRVIYISAEMYPLVKVGGLGDVAGSLPRAINNLDGYQCSVVLPGYSFIEKGRELPDLAKAGFEYSTVDIDGLTVYMVHKDHLFEGEDIYHVPELWRRFAEFSHGAAILAGELNADIIHANDWHAALSLVYAREMGIDAGRVLSIHNMQHQGVFPGKIAGHLGVSYRRQLLHGRNVNFLLAGIRASHAFNVVSRTYAREIKTPEYGFGLENHIRRHSGKLWGILNGIDYKVWNPAADGHIPCDYHSGDTSGKAKCKEALCSELGFEPSAPLYGMVSRIADQKGIDILLKALPALLREGGNAVILGTGNRAYEKRLTSIARRHSGIAFINRYDEELAHRIYAGSDFFLMPSRFEPCGLGQLIAMRYGTIPIVRRTGGLRDTVRDVSDGGWGVCFDDYSASAFKKALKRSLTMYGTEMFYQARIRAMEYDSSWERTASEYGKMYEVVLDTKAS